MCASFNDRMNYEESLKDYRDMYSVMKTQLEKGIAIGEERGRQEATLSNARAFIEKGFPKDVVQQALGLTDEQMKELA